MHGVVNSLWILCQQGWKISQTALEKQCSDHVTGTEWNLSSRKYHRCKRYGIISTKFKMSCKLVFYIYYKCSCFVCHRTFLKVRKRQFDCSCLICIVFLLGNMLRKLCLRRRRYWYLVIMCVFLLFAYIQIISWNSGNPRT